MRTKDSNLQSMSVAELWALYEIVTAELRRKMVSKRDMLETRQRQLGGDRSPKRAYPKVVAKYRNPKNPSETWTGRGKQPRWLVAEMRSGKKRTDFLIR
jgi:DNA-binding protein H-NS